MSGFTLIVAATITNGIGRNSSLPWRLPLEMAYFARVTSEAPEGCMNVVIMGRNTWESIPQKFRPLRNRANIVISRNKDYQLLASEQPHDSPIYLHSDLHSALNRLSGSNVNEKPIHRSFIIGGASVYAEALALPAFTKTQEESMPFVDRVLLTRIISPTFEDCDVFMPDFLGDEKNSGRNQWTRTPHETLQSWVGFEVPAGLQREKGVDYEFQMWVR